MLASLMTITTPTQATYIPSIPPTTQHGKQVSSRRTINIVVAAEVEGEEETAG